MKLKLAPPTEPVSFAAALTVLFGSVITLLNVFALIHWTGDEYNAVLGVWSASMALYLGITVRNYVTPNVKVPGPQNPAMPAPSISPIGNPPTPPVA